MKELREKLRRLSIPQLKSLADDFEIDVSNCRRRNEYIDAIVASGVVLMEDVDTFLSIAGPGEETPKDEDGKPAQEEAAQDLGATPLRAFWTVTLPTLKLSLVAAGLLIFTLSMDEIAVSFFLIGRQNTLPLEIWARLRRGITPEINAVSTIIFLVSVFLILIWYRIRTRSIGPEAQELLERP